MRLLNMPFTNKEKDNKIQMLDGCICRICVSDDPEEIVRMVGFANDYISMLAYSRMIQIREKNARNAD